MKPRKRIASISPSKRASVAAYNLEARRVVLIAQQAGIECPVCVGFLVTCIHHARGKGCESLRHDKRGWFLMTVVGNGWVHKNHAKARKLGILCPVGKWGTPFKPDEPPMPGSVAEMEKKSLALTGSR